MKIKEAKLLIFDFDGTIVDSKQVYYHSLNLGLEEYGFSRKQIDSAIGVGLSLSETLKKLGFGWFQRLFLKKRIMRRVLRKVSSIRKCKDVDSIKLIPGEKILVTNSLREFALPVLKHLRLKNEFKEIYTVDDFNDKAKFLADYLKKRNIPAKDVLYIGDRVADIKLARKVGCKSVIVAGKCAWDSGANLLKNKPDFLIGDIEDLRKII
ncbi:MAG: HAD hydrolase-like protein [Candidatus Pacearchaeota archaeon]|nr:HAD hydrolase-like protein [Candidatus Pacearchaeota archaeon]